jgi:hypothetical protein
LAIAILLYHLFHLSLFAIVGSYYLVTLCNQCKELWCNMGGGNEKWGCYILWSSFALLHQPCKNVIASINYYLGGMGCGWREPRCVDNMFDSMSTCLLPMIFFKTIHLNAFEKNLQGIKSLELGQLLKDLLIRSKRSQRKIGPIQRPLW